MSAYRYTEDDPREDVLTAFLDEHIYGQNTLDLYEMERAGAIGELLDPQIPPSRDEIEDIILGPGSAYTPIGLPPFVTGNAALVESIMEKLRKEFRRQKLGEQIATILSASSQSPPASLPSSYMEDEKEEKWVMPPLNLAPTPNGFYYDEIKSGGMRASPFKDHPSRVVDSQGRMHQLYVDKHGKLIDKLC